MPRSTLKQDGAARPQRRLRDQSRRCADVLVEILAAHGVDTIFGLPGGTIAPLFDALLDYPEIKVVTTRHEAGAAFAAAGYARVTGRLGVVMVTSGPGVLNALSAIASARCDDLPVLLLAGETPRANQGRGMLQDGSSHGLGLVAILRQLCKWAEEAPSATAAAPMLERAIATAQSGRRGPTALTLPFDISHAELTTPKIAVDVQTSLQPVEWAMEWARKVVQHTQKGLLFVGAGVRFDEGPAALLQFAEKSQWPVMTTPKGKGIFPESHPLCLGVFGMGGNPSTYEYLKEGCDTIIVIGTGLGDLASDGWAQELMPSRTLIHVDIDVAQVSRSYAADLTIALPAEIFLREIHRRVEPADSSQSFSVSHHPSPPNPCEDEPGSISPQQALVEIQQILPNDAIYCIDSGEHFLFATHYLKIEHPDSYIAMTGLGSMGSSIPAAMGAQLAHSNRSVAVIIGDGGFAMVANEIATAATYKLPLRIFVFNDQRLGMIEKGHRALFGRTPGYSTAPLDICKVAKGFGACAYMITRPHQLELFEQKLDNFSEGPLLFDIRIDAAAVMPKPGRLKALGTK